MSQRITSSLKIVREIQQQILDKKFCPGERLPTERELAIIYNVSRIPVREALKILAQQGLVEIRHGSGNYVRQIGDNKIAEQIAQFLFMSGAGVEKMTQVWEAVEIASARRAARNRSSQDMLTLWELNEAWLQHSECLNSKKEHALFEIDRNLHVAIAASSQNPLFASLVNVFHSIMRIGDDFIENDENVIRALKGIHAKLIKSIEIYNEKAARDAVEEKFALISCIFQDPALSQTASAKIESAFFKFICESN